MGYNLIIGERVIEVNEEGTEDEYISVWAEKKNLEEAPAFGEPTDNANIRWPSYSSWFNALTVLNANELFYDENGQTIGGHPGYFRITPEYYEKILIIENKIKKQYPNCIATYDENHPYFKIKKMVSDNYSSEEIPINFALCRLEWMKFWTKWALDNCKNPVFCNN